MTVTKMFFFIEVQKKKTCRYFFTKIQSRHFPPSQCHEIIQPLSPGCHLLIQIMQQSFDYILFCSFLHLNICLSIQINHQNSDYAICPICNIHPFTHLLPVVPDPFCLIFQNNLRTTYFIKSLLCNNLNLSNAMIVPW